MIGISSFGIAFVAGKNLVPNPATGKTAFVIFCIFLKTKISKSLIMRLCL